MSDFDILLTLFSAEIESQGDQAVIQVPENELDIGDLETGETYRVAILPTNKKEPAASNSSSQTRTTADLGSTSETQVRSSQDSGPPVQEGETLEVEIEDVGDQGDGIARIDNGYIVFVPDTSPGDRVEVEITAAQERFAFAAVRKHEPVTG